MTPENYILGTRGSLLARTQSSLIAQEIQEKTLARPETKFIKTQGDEQTQKQTLSWNIVSTIVVPIENACLREENSQSRSLRRRRRIKPMKESSGTTEISTSPRIKLKKSILRFPFRRT